MPPRGNTMATTRFVDDDLVPVFELGEDGKKQRLATLLWGDEVRVLGKSGTDWELDFSTRYWDDANKTYAWKSHKAFISSKTKFRDASVMKVRFVDVGQGDGAMIESPGGRLVVLDGGEEDHFKNYVSTAWAHVLRDKPLKIDAIVVSHGDADHFAGLPRLVAKTRGKNKPAVVVDRVFHNGLVKASGTGTGVFGATKKVDGITYATELEDDLTKVPPARMNKFFVQWQKALETLRERNKRLEIRRLEFGDEKAFKFLEPEGIKIDVLAPGTTEVDGQPALPFLRQPGSRSLSASHTINGHSVVLKVTYGNVRFLFGADLNEESELGLLERTREAGISLASEILKVPHHGSADFSPRMLEAVRPVVSVVSSGDENETKEYIHPRAGLVGALGKYSRATVERPLVYVTEMVAFFKRLGEIDYKGSKGEGHIKNAYQKTTFGIVHVRTDGERVLVATHSGKDDMKETYVFHVDKKGDVSFD